MEVLVFVEEEDERKRAPSVRLVGCGGGACARSARRQWRSGCGIERGGGIVCGSLLCVLRFVCVGESAVSDSADEVRQFQFLEWADARRLAAAPPTFSGIGPSTGVRSSRFSAAPTPAARETPACQEPIAGGSASTLKLHFTSSRSLAQPLPLPELALHTPTTHAPVVATPSSSRTLHCRCPLDPRNLRRRSCHP